MRDKDNQHCTSSNKIESEQGADCVHEQTTPASCKSHMPSSCCAPKPIETNSCHDTKQEENCCAPAPNKTDWLLWGSLIGVSAFYLLSFLDLEHSHWLGAFSHSVRDLMHVMWWGLALGILMVGLLSQIPQNFVLSVLGKGGTKTGLLRATFAGVFMDLCSHGILMVGMELRRKGASLGQVMAFLIASPWNSLSLTLIMIALIGLPWTLAFIALSMVIGLLAGWLFDRLEENGTLPPNPNKHEIDGNFEFWPEAKRQLANVHWDRQLLSRITRGGMSGARIILKWLLFGVLLASAIRAFVSLEDFQNYFGPTIFGLIATLIAATIIEVCSEGSTPIAADLMTRANAPGNSFAFLMGGVATDYTEIMVIKETTSSWKTALFLPLLTLPQVFVVAWLLNVSS
ncbi:ATPase [Oleiphilus sp. HI0133]|nr:ATPase [Oleiphilus sp. HI0133]